LEGRGTREFGETVRKGHRKVQGGSNMTGTDYTLFTHKSVPVIFEPPCILAYLNYADLKNKIPYAALHKHWKSVSVNLEMTLVKNKNISTSHI
jgi:hypothetical protein